MTAPLLAWLAWLAWLAGRGRSFAWLAGSRLLGSQVAGAVAGRRLALAWLAGRGRSFACGWEVAGACRSRLLGLQAAGAVLLVAGRSRVRISH